MSIDEIIMSFKERKVEIYRVDDEPNFTHIFTSFSLSGLKKRKVLYNSRDNTVFRDELLIDTRKKEQEPIDITTLNKENLYLLIQGGLKSTIDSHGDISLEYIRSAAKRITGAILSNEILKNKKRS